MISLSALQDAVPGKTTSGSHPGRPLVEPVASEITHVIEEVKIRRPWHSPLLFVGLVMLQAGLAAYAVLFVLDRHQALAVAGACGTLFAAGKEAGIPVGTKALGGQAWLIGGSLLWLDAAMSLVIYPFVEAAMRGAQKQKGVIGHMVRGARRRADKKRAIVDKYGGIGLFLFMIVPFGFNGPLIGMVVGRLVGLSAKVILVAVMAAISFTTIVWTILWEYGPGEWLDQHMPSWVPAALAMSIAAVAILTSIVAGRREKKREEAEALARAATGAADD